MIQILGLRSFKTDEGKDKVYDAFMERGWTAPSLAELFDNPEKYLEPIPAVERWNLFYTVATCTSKKREFQSMSALCFDIDGLDVSKRDEYIRVFCKTLAIKPEQTATIFSGNGLHFYIGLQIPIVDKSFFTTHREHYRALVGQLDKALKSEGLPGKADPTVFDARRIMRLPGTVNRKPGKPERMCQILQPHLIPIPFDITQASGIPHVGKEDQLDGEYFKKFPKTDNAAILTGCNFLKFAKANASDISEPQWYAALSITARMNDGQKLSHELSAGHPGYSAQETDLKIDQATSASGPRTCKAINNLWEGCKTCPNYNKVNSPIMLISPDTIKTEATGFHDMIFDPDTNKLKRGKPNFEDLRRFFQKKQAYVSQGRVCFIYTGTHYVEFDREKLESFAQDHFNPTAHSQMAEEFRKLVHRTNLVESSFWEQTTHRKVNFQNGVLSLDTHKLEPHTKDLGFRYVLPYAYDEKAKAPVFERFLKDVTGDSQSLQAILLEFMGYSLSNDDCKAQKALLLSGWGANGKSTFVNTLTALAGKDNCQSIFYTKLSEDYYKIRLQGALFNISEETPSRGTRDSSEFKNMVTGGMVMARGPYQAPVRFRMKAKLIFLANEAPATNDTTDGFFRRFIVVPFSQKFTDENGLKDPFIEEKLLRELPGIFNLVIKAYDRLVDHSYKFSGSDESDRELESYRENVDPAMSWFKDWVTLEDAQASPALTTITDLHASYFEYFDKFAFRKDLLLDVRWFGRKLSHMIPDYKLRSNDGKPKWIDGKAQRVIRGVKCPELMGNKYGV